MASKLMPFGVAIITVAIVECSFAKAVLSSQVAPLRGPFVTVSAGSIVRSPSVPFDSTVLVSTYCLGR